MENSRNLPYCNKKKIKKKATRQADIVFPCLTLIYLHMKFLVCCVWVARRAGGIRRESGKMKNCAPRERERGNNARQG